MAATSKAIRQRPSLEKRSTATAASVTAPLGRPQAPAIPGHASLAREMADLWKRQAHHDQEEGRLRMAGDSATASRHAAAARALADRALALHDFATTGQPATAADAVAQLSTICIALRWQAESLGREEGKELLRLLARTLPPLAVLARSADFDLARCAEVHLTPDQRASLRGEVPE